MLSDPDGGLLSLQFGILHLQFAVRGTADEQHAQSVFRDLAGRFDVGKVLRSNEARFGLDPVCIALGKIGRPALFDSTRKTGVP